MHDVAITGSKREYTHTRLHKVSSDRLTAWSKQVWSVEEPVFVENLEVQRVPQHNARTRPRHT